MTLAPVRYVAALLMTTQRWAAPALILVGLIAWVWVTPPVGIDTVRIALIVQFGLASWLGHAAATAEDVGQELISTSCHGSATGLLVAKWATAAGLAAGFPLILVVGTWLAGLPVAQRGEQPPLTGDQAWASLVAVLVVAVAGAVLGVLVASVLPGHPGWAATVLILAGLTQAVPNGVPVPILAAALPEAGRPIGSDMVVALAVAPLLSAGLLIAARLLRRSAG